MRWKIIKRFSGRNIFGFSFQDVREEFPGTNRTHLARLLADMVSKGMLCRLPRDIYLIIPLNENSESYVADPYQLAKYLMHKEDYYIGYASALNIHGLKCEREAFVYVVTKRQIRPSLRRIGEITCQFIQHDAVRFFGYCDLWINQFEKAMVSDLERTIVDISTRPTLCGGIIEVGKALLKGAERMDHDKLFYYFTRNMNMAAKKRFLFLSDLLCLEWTADHEKMMEELGSGYPLLDPAESHRGIKRSRFGLKVNVDPVVIKETVFSQIEY